MIDFIRNQKKILEFINYYGGKDILGIKDTDPILKITPNAYCVLKNVYKDKIELQATFETHDKIAQLLYPYLERLILFKDPYKSVFLNSSTFQVTTGGGRILQLSAATWSGARDAATGTAGGNESAVALRTGASDWSVHRTFAPFDTSGLGVDAILTAATFDFHRSEAFQPFGNADSTSLEVVTTTQASATALVNADFNTVSFVSKGSLALSSTSDAAYNPITITDLTIINKTGVSKLGAILGRDLSNSAPTGNNAIGSATTPKLVVTYTLPTSGFGDFKFM